jgi:uncharacterized protein (TIGR02246 family)
MRSALTLLLVLAGCVPQARTPADAAKDVVRARFDALARFDADRFVASMTDDAILVWTAPTDVELGRGEIVEDLRGLTEGGRARFVGTAHARDLRAGVSGDGRTAWVSAQLDVRVSDGATEATLDFRVTEVLVLDEDGRWRVRTSFWSHPVAPEDAVEGDWDAMVPIPDIVDAGGDELANEIAAELHDPRRLASVVAHDAVVIGPGPDELVVGVDAAVWAERLPFTFSREGKNRVVLAPGAQVGWTVTNVDAIHRDGGRDVTIPMRALLVYERRGGAWWLVQAHLSYGVGVEPPE